MSVYDAMAPQFDRRRSLPDGVPAMVRAAVLRQAAAPRILDLGAGAGRIGWPFVLAGDDYIATDLSFGMMREFAERMPGARLVQADGARLPFSDASFDIVLLVQVLSGAKGWRHLLTGALRVLRPDGVLIVGRVAAPDDGIDARMKERLAHILAAMEVYPYRDKPRDDALAWLRRERPDVATDTVAEWVAGRSPGAFLERHEGGARFSVLPDSVKQIAMEQLAAWATERFGPLDTVFPEHYRFELTIHRNHREAT